MTDLTSLRLLAPDDQLLLDAIEMSPGKSIPVVALWGERHETHRSTRHHPCGPHRLRRLAAHVLRSLFRTESRCSHYRPDYPEVDHENWRAWAAARGAVALVRPFQRSGRSPRDGRPGAA